MRWLIICLLRHTRSRTEAYLSTFQKIVTSVTKEEVDYLVEKHRDIAEYYTRRFIDYMSFNQSSFPEYTSNTNDEIHPDRDALFNGWVL